MTWLREHWRPVAVLVVLFASGLATGRFTATAPEIHEVEAAEVHQTIWQKTLHHHEERKARARFTTFRPDGSKATESETEATHTIDSTETTGGSRTDGTRLTTRDVTPHRPDWRVGAMVGVNLQLAPQIGVHGERRILGPVWVGLWVLVQPSPTFNLAGGASVGLEF